MSTQSQTWALGAFFACGMACGPAPVTAATVPGRTANASPSALPAEASADPLGPKPEPSQPAPFAPKEPVVYRHALGFDVWLDERHQLPLVAASFVGRRGSAADPVAKSGTAFLAARMLTEGAGTRGAIEFSQAVDALGADLSATAYPDYSVVSLVTLRKHFSEALGLVADAVVRPRFAAPDFKRAKGLWIDDLKSEQKEPKALADLATLGALFGLSHPYGHPRTGTLGDAPAVSLADARDAYTKAFSRADNVLVVSGDVDRMTLDRALASAFAGYKSTRVDPAPVSWSSVAPPVGRVIGIDRPTAPQSIVAFVAPGIEAASEEALGLARVNAAFGGSFTSRLNQDLREERGLSYGAASRFGFSRERGLFTATAAVFSAKTGEALEALVGDLKTYASTGPTDEESEKTRLQARGDLVETFESVGGTAARFARNAGVGLSPGYEGPAALRKDALKSQDLKMLAKKYMGLERGFLLVVGPLQSLQSVMPKLESFGFKGPIIEYGKPGAPPGSAAAPGTMFPK
jgi:zinc protease